MSPVPGAGSSEFERLRRRDAATVAAVVKLHARALMRAARGMGLKDSEAEDVVQDVFVTFLERLDDFEGRSQVRTWLFGILYRKVLEFRREAIDASKTDPIDEVFESRFDNRGRWIRPPEDIERAVASAEAADAIRRCLDRLPANQKAVFLLREVEEIETPEICKNLGITVTNMGVLMFRARNRLRECMESLGWGQ